MVFTRSSNSSPSSLADPEIELTLARIRKGKKLLFEEDLEEEEQSPLTMSGDQSLEALTAHKVDQATGAITFPPLAEGKKFELKTGIVHLLPKFEGLSSEDPINHLEAFEEICVALKASDVSDDDMKLRAFSFSLKDKAKDWYYSLAAASITSWTALKKKFLDKYFPPTKSNMLKKQISNIEQGSDESLYEYFERYTKLLKSCP